MGKDYVNKPMYLSDIDDIVARSFAWTHILWPKMVAEEWQGPGYYDPYSYWLPYPSYQHANGHVDGYLASNLRDYISLFGRWNSENSTILYGVPYSEDEIIQNSSTRRSCIHGAYHCYFNQSWKRTSSMTGEVTPGGITSIGYKTFGDGDAATYGTTVNGQVLTHKTEYREFYNVNDANGNTVSSKSNLRVVEWYEVFGKGITTVSDTTTGDTISQGWDEEHGLTIEGIWGWEIDESGPVLTDPYAQGNFNAETGWYENRILEGEPASRNVEVYEAWVHGYGRFHQDYVPTGIYPDQQFCEHYGAYGGINKQYYIRCIEQIQTLRAVIEQTKSYVTDPAVVAEMHTDWGVVLFDDLPCYASAIEELDNALPSSLTENKIGVRPPIDTNASTTVDKYGLDYVFESEQEYNIWLATP